MGTTELGLGARAGESMTAGRFAKIVRIILRTTSSSELSCVLYIDTKEVSLPRVVLFTQYII